MMMNLAAFRRNRQTAPAIDVPTVTNRKTPKPMSAPADAAHLAARLVDLRELLLLLFGQLAALLLRFFGHHRGELARAAASAPLAR